MKSRARQAAGLVFGMAFALALAAGNRPAAPADAKLFAELLARLDDTRWKVREEATARLAELAPRMRQRFQCEAENPRASAEVRHRLGGILERLPTVSLFDLMHPPPKDITGRGGEPPPAPVQWSDE